MNDTERSDPARAAIGLIRGSRAGSLATIDDGQPFASLITPASAPDRSLLLLVSGLSPHTSHLRAHGQCSILLMAAPTGPNPQSAPRVSLVGRAAPEPDPALKQRWIALHPYAAFYAGLGDFQLWRFHTDTAQFVGGFASAHRFRASDLAPDPEAVAAVAAAEARIIEHCNQDHPQTLEVIAHARAGQGSGWRMVACDVDGCDLALDDLVLRIPWAAAVGGPESIRAELVRLATAAHNPVAASLGPGV